LVIQKKKTQRSEKFHQGVGERYFFLTVPALSSQDDVGKDRDVVVISYFFSTIRAEGRGSNDAYSQGKSVNNDVEEASPGKTEKDYGDYLFHGIIGGVTFPVRGSYR